MATAKAMELVCARNIHLCFWLPETDTHGRLRVTYSVTSNFSNEDLPVALFCGPMFGSRYLTLYLDHLAKTRGVRFIFADRPGMGGSTPVPLHIRVSVWLETVRALLKQVGVERISIVCFSAGTVYALNTLYHLRDLLNPEAPYIGIVAPWVHNDHSQMALWKWVSRLPNGMLDWNGLAKFFNTRVDPSLSWSGGAMSSILNLFRAEPADEETDEDDLSTMIGTSKDVAAEMQKLQTKFFFAEDTTAANEETRLCLKKGGTGLWGVCEDYEEYVGDLVVKEQERMNAFPNKPKLKVKVFYAESDAMSGKGGQAYFEQCWSQAGVRECIDYESTECSKTNHETVFISAKGSALQTVFADIAEYPSTNTAIS